MESPFAFLRRLTLVPQGVVVVVSSFLPIFAIVSMFPALPSLMAHFASEPNARTLVPWMVTAPGLSIALLAPFAGYLVDRFGRVPLLTWSTLFYGLCGIAPFFLDDLYQIFATRLLLGACEACILTAVNTLIGDYWDDEGRRDWLMLQGAVGPVMGALVIRAAGPVTELQWNGVFLIYAVAFVIFIVMKLYLFEPGKQSAARPAAAAPVPAPAPAATAPETAFPVATMAFVSAVTLFASIIYYMYMVKGALVFNAVGITSPSRISELAALPSLMVMVGAFVFRMLGSKPNGVQLGAFLAFIGVGLFVMGIAKDVEQVVIGIVIQQLGIGMSVPALIAWTQTKVSFAHRGRAMGIWASCFFLGQFLSPWLSGLVETVTGSVQGAFAVAGVAAFVAAIIGFGYALLRRTSLPAAGTVGAVLLWLAAMPASERLAAQNLVIPPPAYRPPETVQRVPVPVAPGERLKLLVVTGENSYEHDWTGVNNLLRAQLLATGRFDVRVIEDFTSATAATLEPYDVVLLNYVGRWNYTDPAEKRWGPVAEQALFDYVARGGGVVVYHASFNMGSPSWPEFERLAGGTMRPFKGSRRSPPNGFMVHVIDHDHPVTRGMRDYYWALNEDMYTNMFWHPEAKIHVLATAFDDSKTYPSERAGPKYPPHLYTPEALAKMPGMDREHPQVWTVEYGSGRVFCISLGHGPDTLQYDGTRGLIARGAEWAASGVVTIPVEEGARAFAATPAPAAGSPR